LVSQLPGISSEIHVFFIDITPSVRNRIFELIAIQYGYLDQIRVAICRQELHVLAQHGRGKDLGKVAVMLGYITEEERHRLALASSYYFARQEDEMIAWVAMRRRLLSPQMVDECLKIQAEAYRRGDSKVPRFLGWLTENRILDVRDLLLLLKAIQRVAMCHHSMVFSAPGVQGAAVSSDEDYSPMEALKEWPAQDVRATPRFRVTDAQVMFLRRGVWMLSRRFVTLPKRASLTPMVGQVIDLSLRGIQAVSPERLSIHQPVDLAIQVPLLPEPVKTSGQVRWMVRGEGRYRVGIMFTHVDSDAEKVLRELATNPFLRALDRSSLELQPLE
jgi:hypothetical protein